MGKKSRIEREEKRDSFATQRTKEKRKHTLIAIAVLSGIAAIVGVSVYNFANLSESAPGAPPGAGILGDEHIHSTGVTLGYLFETMGIGLTDECFIFPDGREFCTNEDYSLKFYVDHNPVPSITDLVFQDGDRILISYGNENQTQIDAQLAELDAQPILS